MQVYYQTVLPNKLEQEYRKGERTEKAERDVLKRVKRIGRKLIHVI